MSLLDRIRDKTGEYILKKNMSSVRRAKKLINLYSASSIGILFELSGQDVYEAVHQYSQKLQAKKIKVKALGYANNKLITSQFLPVLTFDLINNKQLSLFHIPRANCVQDFIEMDFDICINISSEAIFPLKYIAAMSKAKLKAGSYFTQIPGQKGNNPAEVYDILLQTEADHDQVKFLTNIHDYLTILNPQKNA